MALQKSRKRKILKDLATAHIAKTSDLECCKPHKQQMLTDPGTMQTTETVQTNSANGRF